MPASTLRARQVSLLAALAVFLASAPARAQQYWNTNGASASITASNWGSAATGPFANAYSSTTDMVFGATSAITYVSTTNIANISVTGASTVNWTAAGTLTTSGAVRTIDVGAGSILDLGAQAVSTAAGTGFIKNSPGILFVSNGNAYVGGFTLNSGTMILGGIAAMGSGALNINGGTLA